MHFKLTFLIQNAWDDDSEQDWNKDCRKLEIKFQKILFSFDFDKLGCNTPIRDQLPSVASLLQIDQSRQPRSLFVKMRIGHKRQLLQSPSCCWSLLEFLGLNDRWPECNWSHSTFLFSYSSSHLYLAALALSQWKTVKQWKEFTKSAFVNLLSSLVQETDCSIPWV